MEQHNIQPGTQISYEFELPNNKKKWFDGTVIKRIINSKENKGESTFKVFFHEDEEIHDLQFDDEQYITQWKIIQTPTHTPKKHKLDIDTQHISSSLCQQVTYSIQKATDKAKEELDYQLSHHKKELGKDPLTSDNQMKSILCRFCVKNKNKVSFIQAHGLLSNMLNINTDINPNKKSKTFITHLKKKFGMCSSCAHKFTHHHIRIDEKRFTICGICKTKPGNKNLSIPVCTPCQLLATNNTSESLLNSLITPMIQLINSSSNTTFNSDAIMNINATLPGITKRPDGVIQYSYMDHNRNNVNIIFIIEIDKKQHNNYSDDNTRTTQIISNIKDKHTYDKCVLIRLNTDEFLDDNLVTRQIPSIYDRYVIMRCWIVFFFIHSRKLPPFTTIYLFYSFNSNKFLKSSIEGFVGKAYSGPLHDDDNNYNWIYGIDIAEGQLYEGTRLNARESWGKYVAANRTSVNQVFGVHNVIDNVWAKWMDKKLLLTKLIQDNS